MPDGKKTYKVGNDIYDIPESEVSSFVKSFPKAVEVKSFVAGKDTFDIPITEVDAFVADMPDAKPLFGEKKNTVGKQDGSTSNLGGGQAPIQPPKVSFDPNKIRGYEAALEERSKLDTKNREDIMQRDVERIPQIVRDVLPIEGLAAISNITQRASISQPKKPLTPQNAQRKLELDGQISNFEKELTPLIEQSVANNVGRFSKDGKIDYKSIYSAAEGMAKNVGGGKLMKEVFAQKMIEGERVNLMKPKVEKFANEIYKKKTGKTIEEEFSSIKSKVEAEQLAEAAKQKAYVQKEFATLQKEAEEKITQESKVLFDEVYAPQFDIITDQKDFDETVAKYRADIKNIVERENSRLKRVGNELNRQAEQKMEAFAKKYNLPQSKMNELKAVYDEAYNKAIESDYQAKEAWQKATTQMVGVGGLFTKSLAEGFNTWLASAGAGMVGLGMNNGLTDWLRSRQQQADALQTVDLPLEGLNLLRPETYATRLGKQLGMQAPAMALTFATRNPYIGGTIGMITEQAQIAGDTYNQVLQETGDPAKAAQAAQNVTAKGIGIAPLYFIEADMFLKAGKGIKQAAKSMAAQVPIEVPQELVTGYAQDVEVNQRSFGEFFNEQGGDIIKETALLTVLQQGAFGGIGQVYNALATANKNVGEQYLLDIVRKSGLAEAGAVVEQLALNGKITDEQLISIKESMAAVDADIQAMRAAGVGEKKIQGYIANLAAINDIKKQESELAADSPMRQTLTEKRLKLEQESRDLASGGGTSVTVTLPNGTEVAVPPSNVDQTLEALAPQIAEGKVAVTAEGAAAPAVTEKVAEIKKARRVSKLPSAEKAATAPERRVAKLEPKEETKGGVQSIEEASKELGLNFDLDSSETVEVEGVPSEFGKVGVVRDEQGYTAFVEISGDINFMGRPAKMKQSTNIDYGQPDNKFFPTAKQALEYAKNKVKQKFNESAKQFPAAKKAVAPKQIAAAAKEDTPQASKKAAEVAPKAAEKSRWASLTEALVKPETGVSAVTKVVLDEQQPIKNAFLKRKGLTVDSYKKLPIEEKDKIQQEWVESNEFKQLIDAEPKIGRVEKADAATTTQKTVDDFETFKDAVAYNVKRTADIGIDESDANYGQPKNVSEIKSELNEAGIQVEKVSASEMSDGNYASFDGDKIKVTDENIPLQVLLHEVGEKVIFDLDKAKVKIEHANNIFEAVTTYGASRGNDAFADNFYLYFLSPQTLKDLSPNVYSELDRLIPDNIKKLGKSLMSKYGVTEQSLKYKGKAAAPKEDTKQAAAAPATKTEVSKQVQPESKAATAPRKKIRFTNRQEFNAYVNSLFQKLKKAYIREDSFSEGAMSLISPDSIVGNYYNNSNKLFTKGLTQEEIDAYNEIGKLGSLTGEFSTGKAFIPEKIDKLIEDEVSLGQKAAAAPQKTTQKDDTKETVAAAQLKEEKGVSGGMDLNKVVEEGFKDLKFPSDYTKREERVQYLYSMGAMRPVGANDTWYESRSKSFTYKRHTFKIKKILNKDGSFRNFSVPEIEHIDERFNQILTIPELQEFIDKRLEDFSSNLSSIYIPNFIEYILDVKNKEKGIKKDRKPDLYDDAERMLSAKIFTPVEHLYIAAQLMKEGLPITEIYANNTELPTRAIEGAKEKYEATKSLVAAEKPVQPTTKAAAPQEKAVSEAAVQQGTTTDSGRRAEGAAAVPVAAPQLGDTITITSKTDNKPIKYFFQDGTWNFTDSRGRTQKTTAKEAAAVTEEWQKRGGDVAPELPAKKMQEVEAWHGSPYEFGKFLLSKIGTGEGAAAFGWGLYFTNLKDIAINYAQKLSKKDIKRLYESGEDLPQKAYDALDEVGFLGFDDEWQAASVFYSESKQDIMNNYDLSEIEYDKINNAFLEGKRNLYKTTLHKGKTPAEYDWLVWDKTVTDRHINAAADALRSQEELTTGGREMLREITNPLTDKVYRKMTGAQLYNELAQHLGQKQASLSLLKSGIDGIKYPTGTLSGIEEEGAFNYVVFDENAVTIEERIQFDRSESPDTIEGVVSEMLTAFPELNEAKVFDIVAANAPKLVDTKDKEAAVKQTIKDVKEYLTLKGRENIDKYIKAAESVFSALWPNGKFRVFETEADYLAAGGTLNSRGEWNPINNEIAINLEKMRERGIAKTPIHEVIHPIVRQATNNNPAAASELMSQINALAEKNIPGMRLVYMHTQKYINDDAFIQTQEAITEFITRVVDGSINLDNIPAKQKESLGEMIVSLINDIFDLLGINYRLAEYDDLKKLSEAVKKAFVTGDVNVLRNILGGVSDRFVGQIMQDASPSEIEDWVRENLAATPDLTVDEIMDAIAEDSPETIEGAKGDAVRRLVERIVGEAGAPPSKPPKSGNLTDEQTEEIIGIRHADTERYRIESGLPPYEKTTKTDDELEAEADKLISSGYNFESNIDKVLAGEKMLSDAEQVAFGKYMLHWQKIANADPTNANINRYERVLKALEFSGTVAGRALRARQLPVSLEPTLADFLVRQKEESGVDTLTDEQIEVNKAEFEELQRVKEQYEARIEQLEKETAERLAEENIKNKRASKSGKPKTKEEVKAKIVEIKDKIKERLKKAREGKVIDINGQEVKVSEANVVPYLKDLIAIAPEIPSLVEAYIELGIVELSEIAKKLKEDLSEEIPDITEDDAVALIAGEHNTRGKMTKNETQAKLRELRVEARLVKQLAELEAGKVPTDSAKKVQRNRAITELRKKIKEHPTNELPQYQKRLKSQIEKLERDLSEGKFAPEPKRPIVKIDEETRKLKKRLVELKTQREIRLLRDRYEKQGVGQKAWDALIKVANIPRTLMASADLSAPLRQAIVATIANPSLAFSAFKDMFKAAKSQSFMDEWFFDLENDPDYELMKELKLGLSDPNSPFLRAREEAFMSGYVEQVEAAISRKLFKAESGLIVKASERAYVMYLNKMRVDLFKTYASRLRDKGMTPENSKETYEAIAKYVNNVTGRGNMAAKIEQFAAPLSALFFSPRLIASRLSLLNPLYIYKLPPDVRKIYAMDMAKFIGVGLATVGAFALLAGEDDEEEGISVDFDPRSSDFLKIRKGDTRWDIWGGFQQYFRTATQIALGEKKNTTTNEIVPFDEDAPFGETRGKVLIRFVRNKLAPIPSFAWNAIEGRTSVGEKVELREQAINYLTPLLWQQVWESGKDDGAIAAMTVGIPSVFGVGVEKYGEREIEMKPKVLVGKKEYKLTDERHTELLGMAKKENERLQEEIKKFPEYKDKVKRQELKTLALRAAKKKAEQDFLRKYKSEYRPETSSEARARIMEENRKERLKSKIR